MVVLLEELVFALDGLVGDHTWVHPEGGTTLLLRHGVHPLHLLLLLVQPGRKGGEGGGEREGEERGRGGRQRETKTEGEGGRGRKAERKEGGERGRKGKEGGRRGRWREMKAE